MITGETKSGFRFEIDDDATDDMEILENIARLENGDMSVVPAILAQLLGEAQKKALYEFCRKENGRVSAVKVMSAVKEIFDAAAEENKKVKN